MTYNECRIRGQKRAFERFSTKEISEPLLAAYGYAFALMDDAATTVRIEPVVIRVLKDEAVVAKLEFPEGPHTWDLYRAYVVSMKKILLEDELLTRSLDFAETGDPEILEVRRRTLE